MIGLPPDMSKEEAYIQGVADGVEQEHKRLVGLLTQEAQNVLDSGIRPSGKELDAWNYVARHFYDNAEAILSDRSMY